MEAAIRFSQNSLGGNDHRFIRADVNKKSFQLSKIRGQAIGSNSTVLEYDTLASFDEAPTFRAFDWHPHPNFEHLVAIGQPGGEASLLSLTPEEEQKPAPMTFPAKQARPCNAVSISSNHLLAHGLDRHRSDYCLYVWDFSQRLPSARASGDSEKSSGATKGTFEPLHRFAHGDPVFSIKFFPTSPQLFIAGSKSQLIRLYDLREPSNVSNTGLQFSTRCCFNLAIDWQDENFFASCLHSGGDAGICLWDRRMSSRMSPVVSSYGSQQPEPSLELRNVVDTPASIWSLRFSKSKRGCLGTLSSDGKLKMYEIGKGMVVEEYRVLEENEEEWEKQLPQEAFLERTHDVEKAASQALGTSEEVQVLSFDFTTRQDFRGQPSLIALLSNGSIVSAVTTPPPVPTCFHPAGFMMYGNKYFEGSVKGGKPEEILAKIQAIKSKTATHESRSQAQSESRKDSNVKSGVESSLDNQSWQADLGFRGNSTTVPDLVSMQDIAKSRCKEGYGLDPMENKKLVGENSALYTFWEYVDRAQQFGKWAGRTQDNLDLSHLGIYSIWMEDLPAPEMALRSNGSSKTPSSARLSKAIEGLVKEVPIAPFEHLVPTEYVFNRQVCMYISNMSWTKDELKEWTEGLVAQGMHSKAAFVALISGEEKLAKECLLDKKANKDQRSLALALTGALKKKSNMRDNAQPSSNSGGQGSTADDDDELWVSAINNALSSMVEVYGRAILTYVKTLSWSTVLQTQKGLPIKYRLAIALRHLDDSALTKHISETTAKVIGKGALEGVHLTGLGTMKSFELLQRYVDRFNDLQTSVLALCFTIPRYMPDHAIRHKFESWKKQYRATIMSWGDEFMFERAEFDVFASRLAIDNVTGESLVAPPKPQVRLVCSHCNGDLAHHAETQGDESRSKNSKGNPLAPAVAAAKGTVCPHCGRGLPRCAVCDEPLGQEDTSFMKWHGAESGSRGVDKAATERMAGSVSTIVGGEKEKKGKEKLNSNAVVDEAEAGDNARDAELKRVREEDERMARFTVICTDCHHGFHYQHARMWFEGDLETGTQPHEVCPEPECKCLCFKSN